MKRKWALLFSLLMLLSTAPACAQAPADEALTPENTIYIPSAGSAGRIPVEELISCTVGSPDRVEDVLGYEHIVIDAACLGDGADAVLRAASERCADILILGDISENSVRQHFGMEPVETADLSSSPAPAPEETAADGSVVVDMSLFPSIGKKVSHDERGTTITEIKTEQAEDPKAVKELIEDVFAYDYLELATGISAEALQAGNTRGAEWTLINAPTGTYDTERCTIRASIRLYRNPSNPLQSGEWAYYSLYRADVECKGSYQVSTLTMTGGGSTATILDYSPLDKSSLSVSVTVSFPWGASLTLNDAVYVGTQKTAGGIDNSSVDIKYQPAVRQDSLQGAVGIEAKQSSSTLSSYGRCTVVTFGPGTTSLTDSVSFTTDKLLASGS